MKQNNLQYVVNYYDVYADKSPFTWVLNTHFHFRDRLTGNNGLFTQIPHFNTGKKQQHHEQNYLSDSTASELKRVIIPLFHTYGEMWSCCQAIGTNWKDSKGNESKLIITP